MPKLSTISVKKDTTPSLEDQEHLEELFPESLENDNQPKVRYPKLFISIILMLLFIVLSRPEIYNMIIAITPSFKEMPYLATIVLTLIFGALTYILLKSKYFE